MEDGAGPADEGAILDTVQDGRHAAALMRRSDPPVSYGKIAAALGVSSSTAYRWANTDAFEYDRLRSRKPGTRLAIRDAERLDELRRRSRRRHPRCRRCGASPGTLSPECWRCRLVERHATTARLVLELIDDGAEPSPEALRAADPELRDVDVRQFLRQLANLGWLEAPGVTTEALAHRDVVHGLADARPTEVGRLEPAERDAAMVAAACLMALRLRV